LIDPLKVFPGDFLLLYRSRYIMTDFLSFVKRGKKEIGKSLSEEDQYAAFSEKEKPLPFA
jgi:hypothetical protein